MTDAVGELFAVSNCSDKVYFTCQHGTSIRSFNKVVGINDMARVYVRLTKWCGYYSDLEQATTMTLGEGKL